MRKVSLLDCTLRDGGYINDWEFGFKGIVSIIEKLEQTGIEIIEVGFLKGDTYNPDKAVFPDISSLSNVLKDKKSNIVYVGMLDMSDPIPLDRIPMCDGKSVDGIRVIFKKNKMEEAYRYCKIIKERGYKIFVNFVSTDAYTDKEFIEGIEYFNDLCPYGMAIVDTFGMLKRKNFKRLVAIADNNMKEEIALCYHAHNNLQQAFGNAEELVEMNLKREVIIDACVFGMGRGAGNLNLELFAEYMNENYDCKYKITPMLEIMDEYLVDFYRDKFWGYSLPLYLSASLGCHPNYAIYLAEKNTLTEKVFSEILGSITPEDKLSFSKDKAEYYYIKYFDCYYNDKDDINELQKVFNGKQVVLLAPGQSLRDYEKLVKNFISDNTITMSVNFYNEVWAVDYVFTSNARRFNKLQDMKCKNIIATSNLQEHNCAAYSVNFSTYTSPIKEVFDNAGLMALRLLYRLGVDKVLIAGMDGYNKNSKGNYINKEFEFNYFSETTSKNEIMADELSVIRKKMSVEFITPTFYNLKDS